MKKRLVEENCKIPFGFKTENYIVEKLTPKYAELDYDAVMSSKNRLRNIFQENDIWPDDNMTLRDNVNDLKRHENEFNNRLAFAYTVLSPNKEKCLGCIYIDPPASQLYDCEVYYWMRDDSILLEADLKIKIKNWLAIEWPFQRIVFPGREHPFTDRNKLKNI